MSLIQFDVGNIPTWPLYCMLWFTIKKILYLLQIKANGLSIIVIITSRFWWSWSNYNPIRRHAPDSQSNGITSALSYCPLYPRLLDPPLVSKWGFDLTYICVYNYSQYILSTSYPFETFVSILYHNYCPGNVVRQLCLRLSLWWLQKISGTKY